MTKISNYENDNTISIEDRVLGSDGDNLNATKNYKLGDLANWILDQVENGAVDNSPRILVTPITAGAVIDGQGVVDDNPAKAFLRSFKSTVAATRYEILLVKMQRQVLGNVDSKEDYKLLDEQYYWRGGEGNLQDLIVDPDNWQQYFVKDYSIEVTQVVSPPTKGSEAETATVPSTDTSDPASTVSNAATLVPLDSDAKNQYVALYNTSDDLDYRFYTFEGPAGNYGSGGLTATPAMFTEITQVEEVEKTKLSQFTNDGDGSFRFVTTDELPANVSDLPNDAGYITSAALPTQTSDLTNDGDGVNNFATVDQIPVNTSDLVNDSGFITSGTIPVNTSDLVNDGDGSGVYIEVEDISLGGENPITKRFKVVMSAAAVRNISTTPVVFAASPGVGYAWDLAHSRVKLDYTAPAFDGGGDLYVMSQSAVLGDNAFMSRFDPAFLNSTSNKFESMRDKGDSQSPVIIANDAVVMTSNADSAVGGSLVTAYITLELLKL